MAPQPERRADTVAIPRPAFRIIAAVVATVLGTGAVGIFKFAGEFGALKEVVNANKEFRLQGGRYTERRGSAVEKRVMELEAAQWQHERKSAHDLAEYRISDVLERCKKVEALVSKCKSQWNIDNNGSR